MKKYKFLLKPIFFIINLLFATWLILKIEKLNPSDFGKYRSIFEKTAPLPKNVAPYDKYYIKKLAQEMIGTWICIC